MSLSTNRFVVGGGWGTPQILDNEVDGASGPHIAVNAAGDAVAVWFQSESAGGLNRIWANRFVPGIGWSTAQRIDRDEPGHAFYPQVAVGHDGSAVCVWYQSDGTRLNVWASRFVPGTGWAAATLIENDNENDNLAFAYGPQVALDAAGNAVAVWKLSDGTRQNVWANRFVVGTGWGTAILLETDNAGSALQERIAVDSFGNAMAVWHQFDGTRNNVWAARYAVELGWGPPVSLEGVSGSSLSPQIGIDAAGNALVAWHHNDGTRTNVWANRFVPGSGWGTASLIETDNAGAALEQQVAVSANGSAVAVWKQSDGTRTNVVATTFR